MTGRVATLIITDGGEVIDPAGRRCDYYEIGMAMQWFACEECGDPAWSHRGEKVYDRERSTLAQAIYNDRDYTDAERDQIQRRWQPSREQYERDRHRATR